MRIFKLSQSSIFRNIFIYVEELNYMKDYMKVKITKVACKFAVKKTEVQKFFWELSKEGNTISKTLVTESVFTKILRYI